ncbi:hypothetical protein [Streptomyces flavofungini]|uniref:hypothetical protein n=1 Tax=Streptomyces flavofungini TaxID=68200 RepID=UPI0025B22F7B|nr:hypothetical protein [Streptomyces flavofungini]WJV50925.1 hypothetical protein QUY26_38755 [Streptomyces flavofungini]
MPPFRSIAAWAPPGVRMLAVGVVCEVFTPRGAAFPGFDFARAPTGWGRWRRTRTCGSVSSADILAWSRANLHEPLPVAEPARRATMSKRSFAHRVGYGSAAVLCEQFVRRRGVPPRAYRRAVTAAS